VYKLFLPSENSALAEACCSVSVEFCIIGFKYIGHAHFLASANVLIRQTSNHNIPCTDLVSRLRMITEAGQSVRKYNSVLRNKDLHPSVQSDYYFFFQARSAVMVHNQWALIVLRKTWRLGAAGVLLRAGVFSVPRGS